MTFRDQIGNILEENCLVCVQIGDTLLPARVKEVHGGIDLAGGRQQTPFLLLAIMYPVTAATPDGLVLGLFRIQDRHESGSNPSGTGHEGGANPSPAVP